MRLNLADGSHGEDGEGQGGCKRECARERELHIAELRGDEQAVGAYATPGAHA